MRYTAEQKEATHRRVVAAASRAFRARGFEDIGIAELMGSLGLTHGGFYAHFADKEALIIEASIFALEESINTMRANLEEGGIANLIGKYLSAYHRDHVDSGCPLPAITAEVARHPLPLRERFTAKLQELLDAIAAALPGTHPERKREKARVLISSMVGAVVLARAIADQELSAAMLDSTHKQLLAFVADE